MDPENLPADPPKDSTTPPASDDPDAGAKKALEAERSARREAEKKLKEIQGQLDRLLDKDKSEIEKLTAKLAEYERKAQEAEQRALRAEVAASKGLTPAQAKRLVGSTLEELEADADELLESFKPQEGNGDGTPPPPDGKPREQLRGGTDPTTPLNGDPLLDSVKTKLGIS